MNTAHETGLENYLEQKIISMEAVIGKLSPKEMLEQVAIAKIEYALESIYSAQIFIGRCMTLIGIAAIFVIGNYVLQWLKWIT